MELNRRDLLGSAGLLATAIAGCTGISPGVDGDGPGTSSDPPSEGSPSPDARIQVQRADVQRIAASVPSPTLDELVQGNTAFALALHRDLVDRTDKSNLLTAPYSISVALAMTYAGAQGETRSQIADALRFQLADDRLHKAVNTLDRRVDPPDPEPSTTTTTNDDEKDDGIPFTLDTVNALWGQRGFPWRDAYLSTLARYYGAGLHTVNFKDVPEAARKRINKWVADQTHNRIPELLPKDILTHRTRFVLTNAVYFRANWEYQFSEKRTEEASFTALDGSTSTVPMMVHSSHDLPYTEQNGIQAIELPYSNAEFGMVALLPPDGEFISVERSLTPDQLQHLFDGLTREEGTLRFPKFTYRSSIELPKPLKELGMPIAFTNGANFCNMYNCSKAGQLRLDDALHDTYISVDEHGTEAAAATAVEGVLVSAEQEVFNLTFDRPFLFCIRHRPTNAVLFLGRVADAGTAQS